MDLALAYDDDCVARVDHVAFGNLKRLEDSGYIGLDFSELLHDFHDAQGLSDFDGVALVGERRLAGTRLAVEDAGEWGDDGSQSVLAFRWLG